MDLNRILRDLKAERDGAGGKSTTGERGESCRYDYGIGCDTTCRLRKAMGSDRYLPFLPIILNWIQQTLDARAHERRPASSFNFPVCHITSRKDSCKARVLACTTLTFVSMAMLIFVGIKQDALPTTMKLPSIVVGSALAHR